MLTSQLCPTLCDPMDCSMPGSSVHEILQARILEWAAIPFSWGFSWPTDQTWVSRGPWIVGGFLIAEPPNDWSGGSFVAKSCLTLCNPMDCSLQGSSLHGIPQARILEWVAISLSRGIFPTQGSIPGLLHCRETLYWPSYQGSLVNFCAFCF